MGTLRSVNVGLPRDVSWHGRTVYTRVWKTPLDGHADEQRAIFVYQLDSYGHWQDFLHRDDFTYGQFGENFTVDGLGDDEVCIGDRYRIGGALFEVNPPRGA